MARVVSNIQRISPHLNFAKTLRLKMRRGNTAPIASRGRDTRRVSQYQTAAKMEVDGERLGGTGLFRLAQPLERRRSRFWADLQDRLSERAESREDGLRLKAWVALMGRCLPVLAGLDALTVMRNILCTKIDRRGAGA
jgi:hypothetical protein